MENEIENTEFVKKSYDCVIAPNPRGVLVIYEEGGETVEVHLNKWQKIKVIDKLISYYENLEEYEKCENLLRKKQYIIVN
jgi:hypothetical protein